MVRNQRIKEGGKSSTFQFLLSVERDFLRVLEHFTSRAVQGANGGRDCWGFPPLQAAAKSCARSFLGEGAAAALCSPFAITLSRRVGEDNDRRGEKKC